MLSFARKQELALQPVAVDVLVAEMGDLLQRSLGPLIRIETNFPADLAMVFMPMMIASGMVPIFKGQAIDLAPRRIAGMAGTVVLDDEVTTAFYRYDVPTGTTTP